MENKVKNNIIKKNICPCLTCDLYLSKNNSIENCEKRCCEYNKQIAREIANDIFFIMNNFHCEKCDLYFNKADYRINPYCPNCGNDLK